MDIRYNLRDELERVHRNFLAKIAKKVKPLQANEMNANDAVGQVKVQLTSPIGFRRWFRLLNILNRGKANCELPRYK